MPTKKLRATVTFSEETADLLNLLADQENKSISSLAKKLIMEALEHREDRALSAIGESRDREQPTLVKHKKAWK